ncbi:MAG: OmpA family protein [Fibrobacter sp.]|nr:OmpA family protein [Fibrobacter sp.]
MKHSLFLGFVLLLVSLSFAQTGLMGGSDGIHQQNAKSLGQWRFTVGTGGNVTIDPWSLARMGVYYDDDERIKLQHFKLSATGNFFFVAGLTDYVDAGIAFNINYDRSFARGYLQATSNIRQGDLDIWTKVRAPFISDSSMLSLAAQFDMYLPIGRKALGLRPRHAWYIRGDGTTNAYTADEVVIGATAIASLDFSKVDIPIRWNFSAGIIYANEGSNTLIYSTGLDWDWASWITAFVEYSGEFRVENNGMPLDFFEDPMLITPGLKLHLPYNIDLTGGLDLSTRMMRVGYDREKEMKNIEDYTLHYVDQKGNYKSYGYVPTVNYAFTGSLTWTFGGAEKAPEPECPMGLPPAPDSLVKVDTLLVVDTLMRTDTVVVADTIRDADSDGVVDSLDACPNTPMGFPVDSTGCPLDEDHDGVADTLDKCPGTPANVQVNRDGCALDFDQDGVPDYQDMCPNTPPNTGVDSVGCAMDEDKDGVPDNRDQCPLTPKGAPVDTTGCPLDSDKDGVPDYQDKCPNTLRGVKVDKKGCPVNKRENLDLLKKGINFKTGSTALTKASFKTLDDIYALLLKFQEVNLEIQGHTDNVGKDDANQKLSQGRAQSAVDYLIKKGVAAERLRAAGYGASKPIADNKTKKGRAQNRRVELVPFYADEAQQKPAQEPKQDDEW